MGVLGRPRRVLDLRRVGDGRVALFEAELVADADLDELLLGLVTAAGDEACDPVILLGSDADDEFHVIKP